MTEFARLTCRIAIPFVLGGLSFVDAADYHLHPDGSDDAPGTVEKPWKTVDRANRQELKPGDRLLFAGGKTFEGSLALDAQDAGEARRRRLLRHGPGDPQGRPRHRRSRP